MNRIQLLDQQTQLTLHSTKSPRRRNESKPGSACTQQQSFFVPMHYEPNYAYPLLIWLHGPCDGPQQLRQVMPHVSVRNYVAVAPACPRNQEAESQNSVSPWPQDEIGIATALARVEEAIDLASSRFNVSQRRVFVAGVDEGGSMALRLGLAAPGLFAGVASLGGPFPKGHQPLANLAQARHLPMLIGHGRDSDAYPIRRVCDELRLFHVAGMSLHLRQYPCGHELTTQMLSDLDVWMMEIVTGSRMNAIPSAIPFDELN